MTIRPITLSCPWCFAGLRRNPVSTRARLYCIKHQWSSCLGTKLLVVVAFSCTSLVRASIWEYFCLWCRICIDTRGMKALCVMSKAWLSVKTLHLQSRVWPQTIPRAPATSALYCHYNALSHSGSERFFFFFCYTGLQWQQKGWVGMTNARIHVIPVIWNSNQSWSN